MSTLGEPISDATWERWLRQSLARTARRPSLLFVEGAAGLGKSRLAHRLLESPEAVDRACVTLAFTSTGVLLEHRPAAGRPRRHARAPTHAPAPASASDPSDAAAETAPGSRRYPDAVALAPDLDQLLHTDEQDGPVLLVAEDVHRAGPDGRDLLRRLLEQPPEALAAVLTYRPEELPEPALPLGAPVNYPAALSLLHIRLDPLDADQVRRIARERLGAESCPPALTSRVHLLTGGLPQVVVDLVRQIEDVCGPKERYAARDVDAAGIPVRLAHLTLGRLAALPGEHRPVVHAAAVLDRPAAADELRTVAGLDPGTGRRALQQALTAGVLEEKGLDRYGFPAPLAATVVYRELPGPVRQDMHRRAARVLARRQPVPWDRLAEHRRLGGGPLRGWLQAVERAARESAAAGDHQKAVDLLEHTLSHPSVPLPVRARLAPLLAHSAVLGLHTEHTVAVLRQILAEQSLPAVVRGQIRLDLGLLLYNQAGMGLEGWVELEQAVDELAERPPLAARAMSALAMPVMSAVPLERNLEWLEKAQRAAAGSGDVEVQAAVAANCVAVLLETGDPAAWDVVESLRAGVPDALSAPHVARGLVNAADAALWLGYLPRVGDLLDEGVDLAGACGATYVEQDGRGTRLLLDWAVGDWTGLSARARAFVAESGVMPGPAADARIVLGLLALAQGEWQQMAAWLSGGGHPPSADSPLPHAATASGALVRTALARDDLETATAEAAAAWDRLRDKGVWAWASEVAPWAVEAIARAGRRQDAQDLLDEFEAGLKGRVVPSAAASLSWSRGVLHEAVGEPEQAVGHYRQAAAMYERMPRPYAAVLTAEAAARSALACGENPEAAVAELTSCVAKLTDLGATWDAARVRATLRTHHPAPEQPRPRGRPGYGDQLSPREEEVVDLASAGLTNREIAATLHLSPRTVEQHVARARKKLESQSRGHHLNRANRNRNAGGA
ncbi:helix-turn-helix transcriptional regulator [Streptomyces sp. MUM 178J]|uniref:helix-turn-helix transcriptional regulator n=1 Tax=Streptomyces sp. MUM 178J TaxID=2791991 RepID=UPI001F04581A|nr:LuxR family transcriptional regulator [Streptomyces sp. MUM 178J]WRQ78339.1 LuxR C-terminal-related transcriptional regulator [Streptomyces sp. MUM 178J]